MINNSSYKVEVCLNDDALVVRVLFPYICLCEDDSIEKKHKINFLYDLVGYAVKGAHSQLEFYEDFVRHPNSDVPMLRLTLSDNKNRGSDIYHFLGELPYIVQGAAIHFRGYANACEEESWTAVPGEEEFS